MVFICTEKLKMFPKFLVILLLVSCCSARAVHETSTQVKPGEQKPFDSALFVEEVKSALEDPSKIQAKVSKLVERIPEAMKNVVDTVGELQALVMPSKEQYTNLENAMNRLKEKQQRLFQ